MHIHMHVGSSLQIHMYQDMVNILLHPWKATAQFICKGYWITSKISFAVPPNVRNFSITGFTRTD